MVKQDVHRILEDHNLKTSIVEQTENENCHLIYIDMGDEATITICVYNGTGISIPKRGEFKKQEEHFYVYYKIQNPTEDIQFDIGLFADLVNTISGKQVSANSFQEFLNAPQEKYSASQYGGSGDTPGENGALLTKIHSLDPLKDDWVMEYELWEGFETFGFGGKTKY